MLYICVSAYANSLRTMTYDNTMFVASRRERKYHANKKCHCKLVL